MRWILLFLGMCWGSQMVSQTGFPTLTSPNGTGSPQSSPAVFGLPNPPSDHHCASDRMRELWEQSNPAMHVAEMEMNSRIHSFAGNSGNREEDIYIPVVVHIMHAYGDENIPDEQVIQGIQDLNDAFANTGPYFNPNGVDTHIRFCLAQQDPTGWPISGIDRVATPLTNLNMESDDATLKSYVILNPLHYLNIWLVNEINSSSMGAGVAGYAYLPYAHGSGIDGIVNEARWFGSSTDYSKVHIHEVGHYLGLYHTFEGGCNNADCTSDGDRVCDTPPDQSTAAVFCDQVVNTCFSDEDDSSSNNPFRAIALGGLGEQNDLFENYMDYGLQTCQFLFTEGQSTRMNAAIQNERQSLLESQGCMNSCGMTIYNVFSDVNVVVVGDLFSATQSSATTVTSAYAWVWQGQSISSLGFLEYVFTNNQIGSGYLYFTITNVDEGCSRSDSLWLEVKCNPAASFTMSPAFADVNEDITFNGFNALATSYQWYLDDALVGNAPQFVYASDISLDHHLYLITSNGVCSDTSEVTYFTVGDCIGGQNNRWIFGSGSGVELDFNSGSPTVSVIPPVYNIDDFGIENHINSIEGMSTISDRNGNLLFYSDGEKLYNRNYEPFYSGMGSGGSSSQGVQIIQDPGNEDQYYVFVTENFGGLYQASSPGFSYLKVDMTMNGGLGAVASSYLQLLPQVNEQQSATRHCNGHDVWVVCHGFNNNLFYSFLITDTGISAPVISDVSSLGEGNGSIGYMKFSPQGDKLVYSSAYEYRTAVLNFDNSTGEITNPYIPYWSFIGYGAYGVEFSADGSKLYYTSDYDFKIYQIDLSSGIQAIMTNSIQVVGESTRIWQMGALQLAPTGEIYIARSSDYALDVIHFPNLSGTACGFEDGYVELPLLCYFGLNNTLPTEKLGLKPEIVGPDNVCASNETINYKVTCGINSWFHLGVNEMEIISETEVAMTFNQPGIDTLICIRSTECLGILSDTVFILVGNPQVELGEDVSICSTSNYNLSALESYPSYLWSSGAQTPTISVQNSGNYWLEVSLPGGCVGRDTIHVTVFNQPFDVPDADPFITCPTTGNYYFIPAATGDFENHWLAANGSTSDEFQFFYDASYGIVNLPIYYINPAGCMDIDTITVQAREPMPPFDIGPVSVLLCEGEIVILEVNEEYSDYEIIWQNGQVGNEFTAYAPGYYSAYILDTLCGGYWTDGLYVQGLSLDLLDLPEVVTTCAGAEVILNAGLYYPDLEWQDGSTNYVFSATEEGTYWVTAHTGCGDISDTTTVTYLQASDYTLNLPDTVQTCSGSLPFFVTADYDNFTTLIWNDYYYSNQFPVFESGMQKLTGIYSCGVSYDSIYVDVLPGPVFSFPDVLNVCDSVTTTLYAPSDMVNIWNGDIETDSLEVFNSGVYTLLSSADNGCQVLDSVDVRFTDLYLEQFTDTTLCTGDTLFISAQTNADQIYWSLNSDLSLVEIVDTGFYYVLAFKEGCTKVAFFNVDFSDVSNSELSLVDSVFACPDELPIAVEAFGDQAMSYSWSTGSNTNMAELDHPGWFSLTAMFSCASASDSVYLMLNPLPAVDLPEASVLCEGENLELTVTGNDEYQWSNGITGNSIIVEEPGWYSVNALNSEGCSNIDSVEVMLSDLYLFVNSPVLFCENDSVWLGVTSNGSIYQWSDGSESNSLLIDSAGVYGIVVSDQYCSLSSQILANTFEIPEFDLGNDTLLISGDQLFISFPAGFTDYIWNDASTSDLTQMITESGVYNLTVVDEHGCTRTDAIMVTFENEDATSFITIPTQFSPRGNGLVAAYQNVSVYDIKIFDDIGRLVHYTNNLPLVWDGTIHGTPASNAVYYYVVNYTDMAGMKKVKKGKTLLMD